MRLSKNPWAWVPSLYFAQGLPYVTVMTVAVIMYKRLGLSNTDVALYTGWLYLPWVIKPFWSPIVDIVRTKRWWTIAMQWVLTASFAAVAFTVPGPHFLQLTLAGFWLTAFASATHDIAADGLYMLALDTEQQSLFVGIRTAFYRAAMVVGQGALVFIAGELEETTASVPTAWALAMGSLAAAFFALAAWHTAVLPKAPADAPAKERPSVREFIGVFASFFKKPGAVAAIAFMLLYRFPEAQLVKLISPFLLDPAESGGLGLSTKAVGMVYGTVGVLSLMAGGIIGGVAIARGGLRRLMMPMAWAMSLTCIAFPVLCFIGDPPLWAIYGCVALEQFGYGFGATAYTMFLIHYSQGPSATSHYAIATGFMALGMMLPGMAAGWIEETLGGYTQFFIWTTACCVTTIAVAHRARIYLGLRH